MSEKMKLLHIVEAMGGGVFTYIVELSNRLCDEFDIYVAYGIREQTPADYEGYFDNRIHLINVKNFTREIDFKKDTKAIKEVRQIVKEVKPDVIHLHSSKAGIIGRLFVSGRYKKFYTPHGYSFLMSDVAYKKRLIYHGMEWIASKSPNCTTIACSKGELGEALKMSKHSIAISNAIDIQTLEKNIKLAQNISEREAKNKKDRPFTVVTLGRVCEQKNPKLFNDIASKLPDVNFVWVGEGELQHELKSENIEITGWLDRQEALEKAIEADAFILTSLWEGLPISLLEAMYLMKPCIVSDVIGNNDVIKNDVNGYVCNKAEDFINAINKVIEGKDNDRLTAKAYRDIDKHYNQDKVSEKYSKIYKGQSI